MPRMPGVFLYAVQQDLAFRDAVPTDSFSELRVLKQNGIRSGLFPFQQSDRLIDDRLIGNAAIEV